MTEVKLVSFDGIELELRDWGEGNPLVLVQTALTADELLPLARDPQLAPYRKLLYYRRGYGRSSPVGGAGSIVRDAADCRRLIGALGIRRAHVLGLSYSGAVALQLAAMAPDIVANLILIEPPPVHTHTAPEFRALSERMMRLRRERGLGAALREFLNEILGPDFGAELEKLAPGAAAQMERDSATFFDSDIPALLEWRFSAEEAGRITCPVLYVGGDRSGQLFAGVRELVRRWLPQAEEAIIPGATHSIAVTHPGEVAAAAAAFLRQYPLRD